MNDSALVADELGMRFGRVRALRGCSFGVPAGRIAALVGPNGAGKTTALELAVGLLRPTEGSISVLGARPDGRGAPPGVSYLAQDKPLYREFRVDELLRAGAALNTGGRWDATYSRRLVDEAGIDPGARVRTLSGGQRSRLAIALALGRRPDLLLLDEPLADLDPLARRRVMADLLGEVAETGMTVLMSTHVLADIEGVCDHLVLLRRGRVTVAGDVESLLAEHHHAIGVVGEDGAAIAPPGPAGVVRARRTGRQVSAVVRGPLEPTPGWSIEPMTLEELVLAHLDPDDPPRAGAGHRNGVAS